MADTSPFPNAELAFFQTVATVMLARGVEESYVPAAPMSWMGQVKVGGPNIQLYGTAKEVIDQIVEFNPDYSASLFPVDLAVLDAMIDKMEAPKAAAYVDCWPDGGVVWYGPATCKPITDYLLHLGVYCGAPAGECSLVSCEHGCGVFFCNDSAFEAHIPCRMLGADITIIQEDCTMAAGDGVIGTKGQMVHNIAPGWRSMIKHFSCAEQDPERREFEESESRSECAQVRVSAAARP